MKFRMRVEHRSMRAAGIDPHIERVAAFFHTGRQVEAGGDFRITVFEPEVGAFGFDQLGHLQGEFGRKDGLVVFIEVYLFLGRRILNF